MDYEEQTIEAVEPEEIEEEKPKADSDLDELFKPPDADDADMQVDDLVSVDEEDVFGDGGEDMSDLVDVSNDDIMGSDGYEPKPKKKLVRRYRRTSLPYTYNTDMRRIG